MRERVNLQSRRELLKQSTPQYRQASSAQKRVLLDTFAQGTGYHRGSGMWLLKHVDVQACEPSRSQAVATRGACFQEEGTRISLAFLLFFPPLCCIDRLNQSERLVPPFSVFSRLPSLVSSSTGRS